MVQCLIALLLLSCLTKRSSSAYLVYQRYDNATDRDDAADFRANLTELRPSPPQCMDGIRDDCPELELSLRLCFEEDLLGMTKSCYCNTISNISCAQVCQQAGQPEEYLSWTVQLCSNDSVPDGHASLQFIKAWRDYNSFYEAAYNQIFPWNWTVTWSKEANTTTETSAPACATTSSLLSTFAIENTIIFVMSVLTASRHCVALVTCGCLGSPGGRLWLYMAIIPVSLNLVSNAINVVLVRRTPGYSAVPFGQLFLLWLTRPRPAFIVVLMALMARSSVDSVNSWIASAVAITISETVIQTTGSVYLINTVRYANNHHYYGNIFGFSYIAGGQGAKIMYVGAMLWVSVWVLLIIVALHAYTSLGWLVQTALAGILYAMHKFVYSPIKRCCAWLTTIWQSTTTRCRLWIRKFRKQSIPPPQEASRSSGLPDVEVEMVKVTATATALAQEKVQQSKPSLQQNMVVEEQDSEAGVSRKSRQRHRRSRHEQEYATARDELTNMGFDNPKTIAYELSWLFITLCFTYMAQWMFWAGWVELAGPERYCPPKIWTISGIWSALSTIGIVFGGH